MKRHRKLKAASNIRIVESDPNPVATMIVPGRRALGESWSKVVIFPDEETKGYRVEREETPAPKDNRSIFVPSLGNTSIEMADYILEYQRKENDDRAAKGLTPRVYDLGDINALFHDWIEMKLRWFKGQSVSGPGGWTQRERIKR